MQVGTYTGTGDTALQHIVAGFQPKVVILMYSDNSSFGEAVIKTADMATADVYGLVDGGTVWDNNSIKELTANGFYVSNYANETSFDYYWIAFGGSDCVTGTYVGNATDDRQITTLGFQPEWMGITATSRIAVNKPLSTGATTDSSLLYGLQNSILTDRIQQLLSNGFEIGTHSSVNSNGVTYYYFALKQGSGITSGTYTGDNGTNRAITGVGFAPLAVTIFEVSGNTYGVLRGAETGNLTSAYRSSDRAADHIKSLDSDGFTVGLEQNYNLSEFYYVAFADTYENNQSMLITL